MTIDPTVVAATIASLVALVGYLGSQRIQRVERRAQLFADAMRAVDQVHELPFLIWRRADTSEETVQRLGRLQSELLQNARYYVNLLRIEAPYVASAFYLLAVRARRQTHVNRVVAWEDPLTGTGRRVSDQPPFRQDVGPEVQLCVDAMRAANSWAPLLRRRGLDHRRRRLETRESLGVPASEWFQPMSQGHW